MIISRGLIRPALPPPPLDRVEAFSLYTATAEGSDGSAVRAGPRDRRPGVVEVDPRGTRQRGDSGPRERGKI